MKDGDVLDFEKYKKLDYNKLSELAVQFDLSGGDRKKILYELMKCYLNEGKIIIFEGYLQIITGNFGMLRDISESFIPTEYDVYLSMNKIKAYNLRPGDCVCGYLSNSSATDKKYLSMDEVCFINGRECGKKGYSRLFFDNLTACYPTEQIVLENSNIPDKYNVICRVIDINVPLGFGSRMLLSAAPFSGKTTIIHSLALSIINKYKDAKLIILLIGERPEEVTEIKNLVPNATIISSTFDHKPADHLSSCEMTLDFAKRHVEDNKNVIILMDSITRLTRSNNCVVPPSNRVLTGGLDFNALHFPRSFFGSARNTQEAGSLTIVATNLVDNNSKFEEVVYEEFKGTGNADLYLDRSLATKGIYPAINLSLSGTRQYEKFVSSSTAAKTSVIRMHLINKGSSSISALIDNIKKTSSNADLLNNLNFFASMDNKNSNGYSRSDNNFKNN